MEPAEAMKVVRDGLAAVRSEKIHTYSVSVSSAHIFTTLPLTFSIFRSTCKSNHPENAMVRSSRPNSGRFA
jgi:hypothetical protein